MSVVMFAIIGAIINGGTGYWICFALYCVWWLCTTIYGICKEVR